MPYPLAKKLPIWISSCRQETYTGQVQIETGADENCYLQLLSGKATMTYDGETHALPHLGVVVLGRFTATVLTCAEATECQCYVMHCRNVAEPPSIDLTHLCLRVGLIDSFFGQKKRFCMLTDKEFIYITFSSIVHEWEDRNPEGTMMLQLLIQEFLLKLARSFHTHNRPTGIHYLNAARFYIQQHYQESLTLDQVADVVGVSRSYLAQLFSKHMGRSVVAYIQAIRCDHAAFLLATTRFPIIDIALETGFNSRQHFARTFGQVYGLTPKEFRQTNRVLK